jgi:hypothetical protein
VLPIDGYSYGPPTSASVRSPPRGRVRPCLLGESQSRRRWRSRSQRRRTARAVTGAPQFSPRLEDSRDRQVMS